MGTVRQKSRNSLPMANKGISWQNLMFLFLGIAIGSFLTSGVYSTASFSTIDGYFSRTEALNRNNQDEPEQGNHRPPTSKDSTMNVVVGIHLDGKRNQTGFMDEWEVHFKSILIHAPLDFDLHVHAIVNRRAVESIQQRVRRNGLNRFRFRNQVQLTCYIVDNYDTEWEELIYNKTNKTPFQSAKGIYTIGAYYRLMADRVLPKHLVNVIYLDTDVVINSNFNALQPYLDSRVHSEWIQIGKTYCSGFLIINLKEFPKQFWDTIDHLAAINTNFAGVHDQYLLRLVREHLSTNSTGILPDAWNIHYSDHLRDPTRIVDREVAFLHFNGIRNQLRGFWDQDYAFVCGMDLSVQCPRNSLNDTVRQRFYQSWPIADYYVRIPWLWVRNMARSQIRLNEEGYLFEFHVVEDP
eukprot:scaffold3596_cov126-Cylindrotheca_fusiformis.AAC.19